MFHRSFLALTLLAAVSCGGAGGDIPDGDSAVAQPANTSPDTASSTFFPVMDFLRGEIAYVDSLPVGIKRFRSVANKQDSGYISLGEFHTLADEFLDPQITATDFRKQFRETSFFDKSTGSATFLYNPIDPASSVTRVDVITRAGDVYDEVESIYMEKHLGKGDTSIVKKLYWKPKRNFQIITQSAGKDGKTRTELVKVVWDNRE